MPGAGEAVLQVLREVGASLFDRLTAVIKRLLGTTNEAIVRGYWPLVRRVSALEPRMQAASDQDLRALGLALKERVKAGETMDALQVEAFALVREVADRQLGGWNAVLHGDQGFEEAWWGEDQGAVQAARAQVAAGANPWTLDLPASVYRRVRDHFPHSVPPFRMRAHDVQLIGAAVPNDGRIAEQKTGEGKTLAAIFAAYLNALAGRKVHIVTVNEYLASRDARDNRPVFEFLSMTCGVILAEQSPQEKQVIYAMDLVYGQNSEFGFDYLRDNLKQSQEEVLQGRRDYAIVDEVDSVLVDEARVPLIISGPTQFEAEHYLKADDVAKTMVKDADFEVDIKERHVTLTDAGMEKATKAFGVRNLYDVEAMHLPHFLDNALKAHHLYERDKQYLVEANGIHIVDEFTGRKLSGRRWSDGLHQAVEAKERVAIQPESQTYATITYQNFFRLYAKLAGMTGTAMTEANEFNIIYKLRPVAIPTNRPMVRTDLPDLIYGTEAEKFQAIVKEVDELYSVGQPVLVGTITVDVSERLSELFTRRGIPHNVLNARQHQREAEIVVGAGQLGAVTIATNMAGRGTDIRLGKASFADLLKHWRSVGLAPKRAKPEDANLDEACVDMWAKRWLGEEETATLRDKGTQALLDAANAYRRSMGWAAMRLPSHFRGGVEVRDLGGLRILGTERHDSRRIDNQLRGRSGRQGDPGSSRFYLSLEDTLMKRFAGPAMAGLMRRMGLRDGIPIESKMVSRAVEKAQKRVEEYHFGIRKNLLEYDQVANMQRTHIYGLRMRVLTNDNLEVLVGDLLAQAVDELVQREAVDGTRGEELARRLAKAFGESVGVPPPPPDSIPVTQGGDACRDLLMAELNKALAARKQEFGPELSAFVLRFVCLEVIDRRWKDHLYSMDHLRHAIGLESYGQKDPRLRYKEEGYRLFLQMNEVVRLDIMRLLFRIEIRPAPAAAATEGRRSSPEDMLQMGGFVPRPAAPQSPGRRVPRPMTETGLNPAGFQPGPDDPCPCGSGVAFRQCHGTM